MTDTFRALCAELVDIATAHCNPDDYAVGYCAAVLARARAALAQSEPVAPPMPMPGDAEGLAEVFWGRYDQPEPVALSPKEVDTREAFTQLRDEILHLLGPLEVNEVLGIIDYYTPEWV
jgi:hypothetical protein